MSDEANVEVVVEEEQGVEVDISDPPKKEDEPKKDPVKQQQNITPDNPRFKDVYRNWKEEQRQNQAKEAEIQRLKNEVNEIAQLKQTVNQITQQSNMDKLNNLAYQKNQAIIDGDAAKAATLESQYNQLMLNNQIQAQPQQQPVQNYNLPNYQQQNQGMDVTQFEIAKQGWKLNNQWYDSDPILQKTADSIAAELANDDTWAAKPYDQVFNEITNRTKRIRPDKFPGEPSIPAPSEGINNNPSPEPKKNVVKLTAEMKKVALNQFPGLSEAEACKKYAKGMTNG